MAQFSTNYGSTIFVLYIGTIVLNQGIKFEEKKKKLSRKTQMLSKPEVKDFCMNLNVTGEELSDSSTVCNKQKHMVLIHANMFRNMQKTYLRNASINFQNCGINIHRRSYKFKLKKCFETVFSKYNHRNVTQN